MNDRVCYLAEVAATGIATLHRIKMVFGNFCAIVLLHNLFTLLSCSIVTGCKYSKSRSISLLELPDHDHRSDHGGMTTTSAPALRSPTLFSEIPVLLV